MNNRGSTVLDYNAIINAIPKPWLDWISANKQTTELEIDQVTIKKVGHTILWTHEYVTHTGKNE